MGTLVYVALGFAAACAAGVYAMPGRWLIPLGIACLAALLAALCSKTKFSKAVSRLLTGCLVGILWLGLFTLFYLRPALEFDGKTENLTVEVSSYSYETPYGVSAEGRVKLDGRRYKVRFYLSEEISLSPGDTVTGNFSLRYTADGGEKGPTYHQGDGIFLLAYAKGNITYTAGEEIPIKYYPAVLERKMTEILDAVFPQDTLPFARALLLGDDRLLDYETDKALQISGIRHVIAVSGLHVSILFGLVYQLCGKHRVLTALFGIPALLLFAAVAGFTPSIVRACLMQSLMILAMLVNREYDPPSALAFAVLVILGINPIAITSVSFQLSVASMVGIFLFSNRLGAYLLNARPVPRKRFGKTVKRWITSSVSVSLSAMVTTTPLCAYYFGMVSLVSVVTNLLTLSVVTVTFCLVALSCVCGAFSLTLGQGIAWAASWPIRYVLAVSGALSKLPYAAVCTDNVYIVAWLIFCYVLLGVFMMCKKKPPVVFSGCIVLGLVAAMLFHSYENRYVGFSVSVMDVGQGQCILLQTGQEDYLVDCGSERGDYSADVAVLELWSRGIFRLDGVIVTHYDKDHVAGVNPLLGLVKTDALYLPDSTRDNPYRKEIVEEHEDIVIWVTDIWEIPVYDGNLTIFPSSNTEDSNESSLCILFQTGEYDILITGDRGMDGEEELMEMTELPQLELLVAGHHGSAGSTGLDLLMQTMPEVVAISVGEDNSYGHPAEKMLERLEVVGCEILRTDQMGTITFRG